ncbi:MAG: response regulator transcription factor [Syntrophothermus sp.]
MSFPPFRLLIVDDQPLTRQSLKTLLTASFPLIEVREVGDGREACDCLENFHPYLIVMDGRMPEMDGIEATFRIKEKDPKVKIILLSMYSGYEVAALTAGADRFVTKENPLDLLREVSNIMIQFR